MKITDYIDFINEQFDEIITNHNLKKTIKGDYVVELENEKVKIALFTEYRVSDALGTTIENKITKQYYNIFDIIQNKTNNNNYLSFEDKQKCKSYNDIIKVSIYVSALVINNYCSDILNGDFTSLGHGYNL